VRALVTGAAGGIGRGICRALAEKARAANEEIQIAAVDLHHGPQMDATADELTALGARVVRVQADLGTVEGPVQAVREAVTAFGGLDAVVSNAGTAWSGPLLDYEVADWDRMFAVNTRATWLLAKEAHSALKASGGSIVAIGSISGVYPHMNLGAYGPSKSAVLMLVQVLAQEFGRDGIRVNAVSPGMIRTDGMTAKVYANAEVAAARAGLVPLGRTGEPGDIADVVAFLTGREARYVNGHNLIADGGLGGNHLGRLPGLGSIQRH
jgi:NAD(P)-dependent dehydrogenase (short-subunit alcohol dehydrogenase family)